MWIVNLAVPECQEQLKCREYLVFHPLFSFIFCESNIWGGEVSFGKTSDHKNQEEFNLVWFIFGCRNSKNRECPRNLMSTSSVRFTLIKITSKTGILWWCYNLTSVSLMFKHFSGTLKSPLDFSKCQCESWLLLS